MTAAFLVLIFQVQAWGQSVILPSEVKGAVGAWVIVVPEKLADGAMVNWRASPDLIEVRIDLLFPGTTPKGKVYQAVKAGRYKVEAWVAGDAKLPLDRSAVLAILQDKTLADVVKVDNASALLQGISSCMVVIGNPPDPKPPDPKPPDPKPPDPKPPIPAPVGFRVIFIYESSQKMSKEQLNILNSTRIAGYLNEKCVKVNGHPEWRKLDKDALLAEKETKTIKDLWAATRPQVTTLPSMVVAVDGAGTIYPLTTEDATLETLKKIGG